MNKLIVYGLQGPDGLVRYVGKSERGLKRAREHGKPGYMNRLARLPVVRWIKKLREAGSDYSVSVLEECDGPAALAEAEIRWIAKFRQENNRLLNCTDGGEGTLGYRHTEETRARMSATRQGIAKAVKEAAPKTPAGDFICSECNDRFDGKRCLNCKRNYYFERRCVITDYCKACVVIKPTLSNGECRECAGAAGLRECAKCKQVLPQLLSFQQKQGTCGECRNGLRRARRRNRR
jgi:hypothetical protein